QEKLDLALRPDRADYLPGDAVRLALEARNEKKEFAPALALVAVVDAHALRQGAGRTARGLPTHFLLTTEVRRPGGPEDADALLGPHPRAAEALDLLLGTQGWRRFAEQDPAKFQERVAAERVPAWANNYEPVLKVADAEQSALARLDRDYAPRFLALQ